MRISLIPRPFTRRTNRAVDGIPVAEQVLGRGLVREALDQLVSGPGGGGVVGGVDMDEFSTGVSNY